MATTAQRYPLLSTHDVSYAKIVELLDQLESASADGRITWRRRADGVYTWEAKKGAVDLSAAGVSIYDDAGRRERRFYPGDDSLYLTVAAAHERMVVEVINRIMADLDRLGGGTGNENGGSNTAAPAPEHLLEQAFQSKPEPANDLPSQVVLEARCFVACAAVAAFSALVVIPSLVAPSLWRRQNELLDWADRWAFQPAEERRRDRRRRRR